MGQGTESSEACADRPTEVSVIKFVSRNRTIEEIAPKKEIYMCKQRGCGKIFTNQEDYKSHEALESLKIRFICREPGCGEESPDPGSMWRHYQEWHNSENSAFVCPYTRCAAAHTSSESLQEHIESTHRQLPRVPTEPEIICFEGPDNVIEEDITRVSEDGNTFDSVQNIVQEAADGGVVRKNEYSSRNEMVGSQQVEYSIKEDKRIVSTKAQQKEDFTLEQSKLRAALSHNDYQKTDETLQNRVGTKFPKNKDILITKENFYVKYEARSPVCENMHIDSTQDESNTVFINSDVSLTKNTNQEHRIELGNLEKVFRSGFERDSPKSEDNNTNELKNNCSDDEEYTPKKQRMSRCKQEPYKCEINGCGKTYKYISHFRHHQDSHKLITNAMNANSNKSQKPKAGKATTISFFICKMPGCGAQLSNVNTLWKHYQEIHANAKPPGPTSKCSEVYRCKITGCEMEFATSFMLYKHFNEVHTKNSMNNPSTNVKTGNGSGVLVEHMFHHDTTAQRVNFKTDLKAKHSLSLNEYPDSKDKNNQSSVVKEESGD
ncbi:hypothetical protein TSAR_009046 [Trichomalopsis sarcophagae]|uniref:C2H2-type domain-containing protein n=1 Tax=Trichomalopsis sarcophagae TaxID=543379 RepID=A0A232EWV3_9HYME|nr:hypothetical protein TSAR_009046 [Trichomalopsis sarcophagae]